MVTLRATRRTVVAGTAGLLIGCSVLLTRDISNKFWLGGVLAFVTLVTVVGIAKRYEDGFTDPMAGVVFIIALCAAVLLYAFTSLGIIGYPRFVGVWEAMVASVVNALRVFILPAYLSAVLVEFLLHRVVQTSQKASSG